MRRCRRAQVNKYRLEILWTYSFAIAIHLVFQFLGEFDFEGEILQKKEKT